MPTYLSHIQNFAHLLTASIHHLLYLRSLYPAPTFLTARFHNLPVHQNRHPAVCKWIEDAVAAVQAELVKGTVAKVVLVIYGNGSGGEGEGGGRRTQVLERWVWDVSAFPVVEPRSRDLEIEIAGGGAAASGAGAAAGQKIRPRDLGAESTDVDTSEQYRALLLKLSTAAGSLSPLPKNCSYTLAVELKEDGEAEPPIGHPQPWIPVQPYLQKERGRAGEGAEGKAEQGRTKGEDLGGVRTTPVRAVATDVLAFEVWVEEGKAKVHMAEQQSGSTEFEGSSGG